MEQDKNKTVADLRERFRAIYGGEPRIFRAPGRVNLIGEHTDYNDGFVMPAAIEFYVWVAIGSREDRKLRVYSVNYSERIEFDLEEKNPSRRSHWSDYVRGVAVMLERDGHRFSGADILIRGDVPIGSGLSSSAAIEVATGIALLETSGTAIDRVKLAKLCRQAENEFVGARVGIMDQFISCCGRAGQSLMLDCRSLEFRLVPIPRGVTLVICNTMVKHELASNEYNTRRAECAEGVHILSPFLPGIRALRDVTVADLERYGHTLPETIHKRCRHVVTENLRVEQAVAALDRGDLEAFGRRMIESHRSLRDDYAVSCAELDRMVELAQGVKGVFGSRMTGGGFGGCTINVIASEMAPDFKEHIAHSYQQATQLSPQIFASPAAEGASEVK